MGHGLAVADNMRRVLYVAAVGTGVSVDHVNIVRAGINYKFGGF